jgi:hypothetical protein
MTEKKTETQPEAKVDPDGSSREIEELAIAANTSQAEQMSELRELTRALLVATHSMQAQNARNAAFQEAISDVKTATKAMLTLPTGVPPNPHEYAAVEDCGCGGCRSSDCCEFEIMMTDVRVLSMQLLEVEDSNVNPNADLELRLFGSIRGRGALIPGMFSTLNISKLANHVGLWTQVNTVIGTVMVKKGQPLAENVRVDAVEIDSGIVERLTGGRDEEGSGTNSVILDCCVSSPISFTVEVPFTSGGQGGGSIEVRFSATKRC